MSGSPWRVHMAALAAYLATSVAVLWPLPLYLDSRFPGPPSGDLGVYAWNLWVFQHEVGRGQWPLATSSILSLDRAVDLSLHNYTVFANLVALPLLPILGVVAAFNLFHIAIFALNAYCAFLLVRHLTGRDGVAWVAGLVFGFAPTLVARSLAHASLVAAAPLPLFALTLLRLDETRRWQWALSGGATLAWATYCDPYYGVYCLVLVAWYATARLVRVEGGPWMWRPAHARAVDGVVLALAALVAAIGVSGGFAVRVAGQTISLYTLYTPVLLLSAAVLWRAWLSWRPRLSFEKGVRLSDWVRLSCVGVSAAGALLSPLVYALGRRTLEGGYVAAPALWRTSMRGVDLLSLMAPNPNSPWLGAAWADWLTRQPGGFVENVASVPITALLAIAAAVWLASVRLPRAWVGLAILAASLSLGPFIHVAGVNTTVPTPWTLLRYVPLLGGARAPARFAVLVALAMAVLTGLALKALAERYRPRSRWLLAIVGAVLILELYPAPRPLFSARIPTVYDVIAADPRDVRVMDLPIGIRDGLSSVGNFSAQSQYFQTRHRKRLVGGYLSRVSRWRVESLRKRPVLAALLELSEGRSVPPGEAQRLAPQGRDLVQRAQLAYVVVNRDAASPALVDFAVRTLGLEHVSRDGPHELYKTNLLAPASAARGTARPETITR